MENAVHVVNWLITLVSGTGFTYLMTNWGKVTSWIPITEGRKAQVRTFAAIMAALAVIIGALFNPDIRPEDLQSAILTVLTFALTWLGAHTTNKVVTEVEKS